MRIAYLTAGAAGMYCGSCLHDNALAKALIRLGHDTLLIPTYTPVLTDETSVSNDKLFFGGLNVYLQQVVPVFRWLPNWADSFLSSPKLVGWVASRAMGTSAKNLGQLTVSMLRGSEGKQKKEVQRLCGWLKTQQPDVVLFSNLLIAGCIPQIRQELGCPTAVVLQGDDLFYDNLVEPYRTQAMTELRRLASQVDLFLVHSRDYAQRMQHMLQFDEDKVAVNPLSIDTADFQQFPAPESEGPPRIGYLARLAPEKGLHLLVDAFLQLRQQGHDARLEIAGWLGKENHAYWEEQQERLRAAGQETAYRYWGSVDRQEKLEFLRSIDVLSVPTPYLEPKGLFVLEALAAGVPYVQPAHGAFPELHERLGGGHLVSPENSQELATRLSEVLQDRVALRALGQAGRQQLMQSSSTQHAAERLVEILESRLGISRLDPPNLENSSKPMN